MEWIVIIGIQVVLVAIMLWSVLRQRKRTGTGTGTRGAGGPCRRDLENLLHQRRIHLTSPLNDSMRPSMMSEVIGQADGVRALVAMLSGPNPQHVLIYGPPGIGKTCAARLALEEAKRSMGTPFSDAAPFIELDATCVRFDERAIADPLMGSVHDPIYQGAGVLGASGVPQPKPGAVSKAHGGVLFLDEIGELHPIQMNKLLKVLEDHRVTFESAYYNPDDAATPEYIHQVFQKGMPADFRLIGATTRAPNELPPALRSRCMEVFFRPLDASELVTVAMRAADRAGFSLAQEDAHWVGKCAQNGREAVQLIQMACGIAQMEGRLRIEERDLKWVAQCCRLSVRQELRAHAGGVGRAFGLAVSGASQGLVIELEAAARPGSGKLEVTGIIEQEELGSEGHRLRRTSTAAGAVRCLATALRVRGVDLDRLDIHLHLPGGVPVDGPSAGTAMAVAVYSAATGRAVRGDVAMTGEITVDGSVRAVGGTVAKAEAARRAGMRRVFVPQDNVQEVSGISGIEVVGVSSLTELFEAVFAEAEGAAQGAQEPVRGVAAASATASADAGG